MDELTKLLLSDPNCYDRAMDLLKRYQEIENLNWTNVEEFLFELTTGENELLDRIIKLPYQNQKDITVYSAGHIDTLVERILSAIGSINSTSDNTRAVKTQTQTISNEDLPIDVLIKRFIESKKTYLTSGTIASISAKLSVFEKIIKENNNNNIPSVSQLDPSKIRHYKETIIKIPARRNGFQKNATVNDWIKTNKTPISSKTIKGNVSLIGEFLTWMEDECYPISKDLKSIFKSIKKPRLDQTKTRVPFSNLDLKNYFESNNYQKGLIMRGSEFWTPLISLFTGARLGEILQLQIKNIYEFQSVWVFDINNEDGRQVKTEAGTRLIPIHSQLINLGLLDYVKERGKQNILLFPEEIRTDQGRFNSYSKRFNRDRRIIGVCKDENTMKDFHSFRHTVRTKLTDASVSETLIDDIIGHKSTGVSIGKRIYTHTQLIPQKKEAIEKIAYS
jgi:integrase